MTQIFRYCFLILKLCIVATLLPSERRFRFEIMGEHMMDGRKFYPLLVFKENENDTIRAYEYFFFPIRSVKWDKNNDDVLYITLTNHEAHCLRVSK